jgi:hypothetical protein
MIGFIGTSLQLQSIITAHTLNSLWIPLRMNLTDLSFQTDLNSSRSQSHVTTDGQSASLSCNKHPSGAYDHIFITVRQLQACWYGALSLTKRRVCRFPESQSAAISLLSVFTFYMLWSVYTIHTQGLCQSRLRTDHAIRIICYDFEGLWTLVAILLHEV